jgi:molybdate transport system regulatory protein
MKLSAQNTIEAKVKHIAREEVVAEVLLDIGGGCELVSHLPAKAVDDLELSVGKQVFAVVNMSNVMIATYESSESNMAH